MQVKEVMTANIELLRANYTVLDAAKKMRDLNAGLIPVSDDGQIVGILTDRDIVIRAISEELNPANTSVREIMTTKIITCNENASVEEAARLMEKNQVRRLIVTDQQGKAVGVCSLGDLATHVQKELAGEIIREVSEPAKSSH